MLIRDLLREAPEYWRHLRELLGRRTYPITQEGMVYHCPLTLSRRHNLSLQQINKALLDRHELSLPHILHVGVTSKCNLKCPACPTGTHALGRPGQHLDHGLYARVIDDLRHVLLFTLFWDWGEPMLHPRLADMIARVRRYRIKSVISTNGTIHNSAERIERLVAARPDVVIVCVDGATQESYEKYRVGGRLMTVLDTVRRLAHAKERLSSRYPVIEFRSLATRYSEREMPELLRMARETGADVFSVKTLRPYDYRGHDNDDELVPLHPDLTRYAYEHDAARTPGGRVQPAGPLRCGKPTYAPTLNADGNLVFCSYAGHEEESFGSVARTPVRILWRSREAREKRLHFLNRQGTRSCETCYFRTDHKPTMLFTVPLRGLPRDLSLARPTTPEEFLTTIAERWWPGRAA